MTQFIRFSLVGVINTLLHYLVFFVLFDRFGVFHLLASTLGFVVAVINSYLMNRYWTFQATGRGVYIEFARFFTVSVVALMVNLMCMALLVEWFGIYPPYAQLLAIVLTLIVNFLGNKYWSFRQPA